LPSSLFIFGGGYGDIYRASWGDQRVALKRMRYFIRGSDLRRIRLVSGSVQTKFCREALLWKDLQHAHILPFLGIDRDTFPFISLHGFSLDGARYRNALSQNSWAMPPWIIVRLFCVFEAFQFTETFSSPKLPQGLEYLHSRNIIHGDLRAGTYALSNVYYVNSMGID
ncbi:hypothetical protein B0H14DRAFT_2716374, partial [Mycena olivaceomarginata]